MTPHDSTNDDFRLARFTRYIIEGFDGHVDHQLTANGRHRVLVYVDQTYQLVTPDADAKTPVYFYISERRFEATPGQPLLELTRRSIITVEMCLSPGNAQIVKGLVKRLYRNVDFETNETSLGRDVDAILQDDRLERSLPMTYQERVALATFHTQIEELKRSIVREAILAVNTPPAWPR